MTDEPLRIALAQTTAVPGDVAAHARVAVERIVEARERGARLVVFPELYLTGYEPELIARRPELCVTPDDARLDSIRRACADAGTTSVLGAPVRGSDGRLRIASLVVGGKGDVRVSYKRHIHGSEADTFVSGDPLEPFDVGGWRVAVGICFDAAHPRHAEDAALRGADVYVVSALYDAGEERRLDLHFGARAMDNRMFAAVANFAGTTGGHVSCGRSGVWGPAGDVIARAHGATEELVVAELDPARLAAFRTS